MTTNCPFMAPLQRPHGKSAHACGAGIDFYAIGKDQELCEVCSVASLGRLPDCGHLDAYAWLEGYPRTAPFVRVELFCGLTGDPLPSLLHCACCPERLPQATTLSRHGLGSILAG